MSLTRYADHVIQHLAQILFSSEDHPYISTVTWHCLQVGASITSSLE
jgi:hypothetical protein